MIIIISFLFMLSKFSLYIYTFLFSLTLSTYVPINRTAKTMVVKEILLRNS